MYKKDLKSKKMGSCNILYVPKGYCTIVLLDQNVDLLEFNQDGNNASIEIIDKKLECQK
jgi:hypothetical protein